MPTSSILMTVQEISETSVTASGEDGHVWRIPRAAVTGTPAVGQTLRLLALASGNADDDQRTFARTVLQELLGQ